MNYPPPKDIRHLNPVFLLGGHDLEMIEIRKILDELNIRYFDNNLLWGAGLSSYKNVLDDEHYFIGIELTKDIPLPKHYIDVDHHNENVHKPSCIEQIAELLDLKLNHWQQLIAANDRGYIPGMEVLKTINEDTSMINK